MRVSGYTKVREARDTSDAKNPDTWWIECTSYHRGWAYGLVSKLNVCSSASFKEIITKYAECVDVTITIDPVLVRVHVESLLMNRDYTIIVATVTVGHATADWVNDMGAGTIVFHDSTIASVSGAFFKLLCEYPRRCGVPIDDELVFHTLPAAADVPDKPAEAEAS